MRNSADQAPILYGIIRHLSSKQSHHMSLQPGSRSMALRLDCRHYRGDRPCARGCAGSCENFEAMGHRILIVKLGALGDVIRTEALLPGLKDMYPVSHITWITRSEGCRMLANNPLIDRLLVFGAESICHLMVEQFDLVISLDKEPSPAGLATRIRSADKRGIGLSDRGTVYPFNSQAHYYFALGLSDELKFDVNQYTYPRLIYEAVGLTYSGQRYQLFPSSRDREYAHSLFERAGVRAGEQIIGLNTGSGDVFANKAFSPAQFIDVARKLSGRGDCRVALLGGPQEHDKNRLIAGELDGVVIDTGCNNTELQFAAVIEHCTAILTGDTTAMHVGIAMRVPVIALFGPTCHQEIDVFGYGTKIVSPISCSPCYKRHCELSPHCMDLISVNAVEQALLRFLKPPSQSTTGQVQAIVCRKA